MPNLVRDVFYRLILFILLFLPVLSLASNQYGRLTHRNQVISIYYHDSFKESELKITHKWLQQVTNALLTVYGELPNDSFKIFIKRSSSRTSPVPWGEVERGEPNSVLLVINPELGYDELLGDWTAFHELSHLLLPYRGYGNIWFSEGLATYYQNIIRARSGLLDETEMWHKIVAGFERGSKEQSWDHINLREVSDSLGETRQFMRVHWSGVLYWLTGDIKLRKLGKGNLDNVLKKLKDCCEASSMSAEAIANKLDELAKTKVFAPLFDQYYKSYRIPDYKSTLSELGVEHDIWTDGVMLDDDASLANIRSQIYLQ